ncbi:Cis-prenyltransferase [Komagataella phaffii CBS 7435]|uniref:Alkyl transferase n=2 Tax=Komagataella phaffii TaxID=460519 RepID=C4QX29_KOMPG|nr:uncharacterized protein PAS_chr1-1_0424 [Komagataella phaffii GS115]AOA60635.1 GQ67_02222T0 [Komagataella phaffii]CAH2446601.1 Cis-prenyltransferase [Komagataella phaffii CBS 7435]AOA66350.1 GQ68_02236T0 [Komagataella phaffii GS115]CAY67802.1 Cis-prenyltransferase involved in synthesis of long-chain dolichols [Komagataella phaffii GS115]SCV11846.1 Cis-prenyltransferase [Komagataella phaffii CBS 7435]
MFEMFPKFFTNQFPLVTYINGLIEDSIINVVKTGPVPQHIALVMDGNRRYAKVNGIQLRSGHDAGADALVDVLGCCYRVGVKAVTIYAFSIENFNRSQAEINTLLELLKQKLLYLSDTSHYAERYNVRINIVGNKDMIPDEFRSDLDKVEELTRYHTKRTLNVCFPFTSRDDITSSIANVANRVLSKELAVADINLQQVSNSVIDRTSPPLDILIRTSGHTRLSDFLTWQLSQNPTSTVVFTNTLWPNFKFWQMMWILLTWSYYQAINAGEICIMTTND